MNKSITGNRKTLLSGVSQVVRVTKLKYVLAQFKVICHTVQRMKILLTFFSVGLADSFGKTLVAVIMA